MLTSRSESQTTNVPFWLMSANSFAARPPPVVLVIWMNELAGVAPWPFIRHKKSSPFASAFEQLTHVGLGCVAPGGVNPLPRLPVSNVDVPASGEFEVNAIRSPLLSIVEFWLVPEFVVVTSRGVGAPTSAVLVDTKPTPVTATTAIAAPSQRDVRNLALAVSTGLPPLVRLRPSPSGACNVEPCVRAAKHLEGPFGRALNG